MFTFKWNGIKFNIVSIGGGVLTYNIAGHSHSKDSYELHFIIGGRGRLFTSDSAYELAEGCFFMTGPNFYHAQQPDTDYPTEDIYIYLHKVGGSEKNIFAEEFLKRQFYIKDGFDMSDAKKIKEEFENKEPDYESVISGLCMKLLTDIVREYLPEGVEKTVCADNLTDKRLFLIENAFLFNEELTLSELSDKIGVCARQTERLLKKYYGKTFRQMKNEQRDNSIDLK